MTWVGKASTSLPCKNVIIAEREASPASYSLGSLETVAPVLLRVSKGQCERIRGIGRGRFSQAQHALYHFCDCELLGGAVADNGLFHFARRELVNLQSCLGNGRQGR